MGIDYGTKRIGIAVTDPLKIIASPHKTVRTGEFDSFIKSYLETETVDEFVVGYPVRMNNTPSETVKYIDPFIRKLQKMFPGIPVHKADERFTSKMSIQALANSGASKKVRQDKSMIDMMSASIILRSFLEQKRNKIMD